MMWGAHLLSASSTTQNVIALSSAESEFYALAKAASRALGGAAMCVDLAVHLRPAVLVDATASKGIASRRGVGRVRHLHTQVLWVQAAVAEKRLVILRVKGTENPADLGTKHLAQPEMTKCMVLRHDAARREIRSRFARGFLKAWAEGGETHRWPSRAAHGPEARWWRT
jgi:hypothetical protein